MTATRIVTREDEHGARGCRERAKRVSEQRVGVGPHER
jgi:hypothetical protein